MLRVWILFVLAVIAAASQGIRVPLRKLNYGGSIPTASVGGFPSYPGVLATLFQLRNLGIRESLENNKNVNYYGHIQVGTPPQNFTVVFDTGSADFWIPSSGCWFSQACWAHNYYKSKNSSSSEATGKHVTITYGTGEINGRVIRDTLTIGGAQISAQTLIEATYVTAFPFYRASFDGVLGLAFPQISVAGASTPLFNMVAQQLIQEPVVSFYFNRDFNSENGGEVYFGGKNTDLYREGTDIPIKVTTPLFWQFDVEDFAVGDKLRWSKFPAVADTGSSFIGVPGGSLGLAQLLVEVGAFTGPTAGVKRQGRYKRWLLQVDCAKISQMPAITFTIEKRQYILTPEEYVVKEEMGSATVCGAGFTQSPENIWILGDVFLGKYYTTFNIADQTVSFADLK